MRVLMVAALLAFASACASAAVPTTEPTPTTPPISPRSFTPLPETSPLPPETDVPEEILQPILEDAAARAGVDVTEVTVVRAQAVTWPDSSLGCPQPGMAYLQVLTDGYWLVVEAGGVEYDYRGTGQDRFILCENPAGQRQPPLPGNGGLDY